TVRTWGAVLLLRRVDALCLEADAGERLDGEARCVVGLRVRPVLVVVLFLRVVLEVLVFLVVLRFLDGLSLNRSSFFSIK
ncbi:MAG TPA: hypothetical protein PLL64_13845, partial [Rhodothermales bacterium]|nr:hypothetical protein [Rhodothermales bacterium]